MSNYFNLDESINIPSKLKEYIEICSRKGKNKRLVSALEKNSTRTLHFISQMFASAEKFTGISGDDLLRRTGLNLHDLSSDRLDSAFAEIRTINFLGLNGFSNIEIIHNKNKKYSDIIAIRNDFKICFEVMCITNEGYSKWKELDLIKYIHERLNKGKIDQLKNTMLDYQCDFMNLAVVIVNEAGVALNNRSSYLETLKSLVEKNANVKLSFTIITGGYDIISGDSDDCIYPEIF